MCGTFSHAGPSWETTYFAIPLVNKFIKYYSIIVHENDEVERLPHDRPRVPHRPPRLLGPDLGGPHTHPSHNTNGRRTGVRPSPPRTQLPAPRGGPRGGHRVPRTRTGRGHVGHIHCSFPGVHPGLLLPPDGAVGAAISSNCCHRAMVVRCCVRSESWTPTPNSKARRNRAEDRSWHRGERAQDVRRPSEARRWSEGFWDRAPGTGTRRGRTRRHARDRIWGG
ncbi:hypothetical protein FTUN_0420 [Frigoriglobus tundricola]|uniref:Uncharacterized protein n=1 Tax=Frigoriglobus tundricola TaxID=2774151 RepID=A0A6M5YI47_9BACT|nr:hypothetical protein FTUN_0420 [Frigoriglobus tundricola]